jgi:hypothetical protein
MRRVSEKQTWNAPARSRGCVNMRANAFICLGMTRSRWLSLPVRCRVARLLRQSSRFGSGSNVIISSYSSPRPRSSRMICPPAGIDPRSLSIPISKVTAASLTCAINRNGPRRMRSISRCARPFDAVEKSQNAGRAGRLRLLLHRRVPVLRISEALVQIPRG